jgi:polysaccharide biosynthesis transport protein
MAVPSLEQPMAKAARYWRLIARYKWQCLIATLVLTLGFILVIARVPNVYEATTTILVDPQQVPEKYVNPAVASDYYTRLNTITQQILSRGRLQKIIEKYNLYSDLNPHSPEEQVEAMRQDITIEVKQGSGTELSTFSLSYRGKQPTLVADVTNELASSFIQWNIASRVDVVAGTKDFLSSELTSAKQNLERQENALREFKMSHLGETPDQTGSNLQALAGLRSALQANVDAMSRLDEEKILLTRSPEPLPITAHANADLTQRERLELEKRQVETNLEQLREHYSDRYPDVLQATRRLKDIKAQLNSLPPDTPDPSGHTSELGGEKSATAVRLELIDQEMKKLQTEQSHIQSQIESYQQKVDAAPIMEQQLVELTRNYDVSKQHYQILLDKSFNIGMAADLEQNQKGERYRVLDPARVPEKPIKPKRKILIPAFGLFALGVSIFCVLLKDELTPVVKTEMELKSLLPAGVQVWGFVPDIEITSDIVRARRWAIGASLVCLLLCAAIIEVIRQVHPL